MVAVDLPPCVLLNKGGVKDTFFLRVPKAPFILCICAVQRRWCAAPSCVLSCGMLGAVLCGGCGGKPPPLSIT